MDLSEADDVIEPLRILPPNPKDVMDTLCKLLFPRPQLKSLTISHISYQIMSLEDKAQFLKKMEIVKPRQFHDWRFIFIRDEDDRGKISLKFSLELFGYEYPDIFPF